MILVTNRFEIPLTKGAVALVDAADFEWLSAYKWCVNCQGYAVRRLPRSEGGTIVRMHRVITAAQPGYDVDHIDGNPLNNQRANLRVVPHQQNSWNKRIQRNNTSGHKGVYWHAKASKWAACITVDERNRHLGLFQDKQDAADAYQAAAASAFGVYARER